MKKSAWTSILGIAVIVLTWLNQVFVEQGIPKDGKAWITFLTGNVGGLIGLVAKDWNVSNSGTNAPAHTVIPSDKS